ncbi:hypothetical protein OS493_033420 [Desmophyllum pertusum]|uniref:MAM domain-containing protein n=1 Tax=Desmophyllum pertusum TaxID=174260 RepID=A0A9X0D6Z3_9CNID|nr:hypothetical protein OS493_033420 [Desmophyllum pertusum]
MVVVSEEEIDADSHLGLGVCSFDKGFCQWRNEPSDDQFDWHWYWQLVCYKQELGRGLLPALLWIKSGHQGEEWQETEIDVKGNSQYKLIIEAIRDKTIEEISRSTKLVSTKVCVGSKARSKVGSKIRVPLERKSCED